MWNTLLANVTKDLPKLVLQENPFSQSLLVEGVLTPLRRNVKKIYGRGTDSNDEETPGQLY